MLMDERPTETNTRLLADGRWVVSFFVDGILITRSEPIATPEDVVAMVKMFMDDLEGAHERDAG